MVSEPLLWLFLSSLVFIGVTPFSTSLSPSQQPLQPWTSNIFQPSSLGSEPTAAAVEEFHTAKTTALCIVAANIAPINFLQVPLRSSCADIQTHGRRPHAPPCAAQSFWATAHAPYAPLHIWVVHPCAPTRRIFRSCTLTCLTHSRWRRSATLALVASSLMSLACVIVDVTCLRQSMTSSFDFGRFDHWLSVGLTINFFLELNFCSPGAPYPVFQVDFIFAVYFCIFFF